MVYLAIVAFFASLIGVKLFQASAPKLGLLDKPDSTRKLQKAPIPVGGGLVAHLVFLCAALYAYGGALGSSREMIAILLCASLVAFIGIVDDRWGLDGIVKSVAEFAPIAAIVAIIALYRAPNATYALGSTYALGAFFSLFLFAWIFGCVNSFNLLDGADGFVGTLGCVCMATLGIAAYVSGAANFQTCAWFYFATLAGFLAWNAPPAKVYFGDSGSLTLGFIVGVFSLRAFVIDGVFHPIPALCLLTLPIVDSTFAIIRRVNAGRSVFSPDLSHLHHHLQRRFGRGYKPLLALLCLQAPLCVGAIAGVYRSRDAYPLAASLFVLATLVGLRLFGFDEITTTAQRVRAAWRRLFAREVYDVEGRFLCSKDVERWRGFWRKFLSLARRDECLSASLNFNLPFANVDWQGTWRVKRSTAPRALARAVAKRVKNFGRSTKMKFEIPLHLDDAMVGILRVSFDGRRAEFAEAVERVEELLQMCADALLPYGQSFMVDSPVYIRRRDEVRVSNETGKERADII